MMRLAARVDCTGCGACLDACSHGALAMREDADGFAFPEVDASRCVGCGACSHVCPSLNPPPREESDGPQFLAAQLRDAAILDKVSSGGAFWALAQSVLSQGGVVYGACQQSVSRICHLRAETEVEAMAFRRSKYLPSDLSGIYRRLRDDVRAGRPVLFSGTSCQVAAVRCFVGSTYSNLVTCEVVCHGIPSMLAWRSYLAELERAELSRVVGVVFRDKARGWRQNQYRVSLADGRELSEPSVTHPFHLGYLLGLFYRRSCGHCAYSGLHRIADLTLADFWKYPGGVFSSALERGVSLVIANSLVGRRLVAAASDWLAVEPVSRDAALASCRNLAAAPHENPNRDGFLALLRNRGYRAASRFYFRYGEDRRPGLWARFRLFLSTVSRRHEYEAL